MGRNVGRIHQLSVYRRRVSIEGELVEHSKTAWKNAEWGFPKGRRNNQESDIECAVRENFEETGYNIKKCDILSNIVPVEEVFIGSNLKSYKHKYFVAFIGNDVSPVNPFEKSEVSKLKWLSYGDCIKKIRPYNTEKLNLLARVHNILTTYSVIKCKN
jgi:8-oxo-dGTP pyrophosphatase MutT (NUDIX family)